MATTDALSCGELLSARLFTNSFVFIFLNTSPKLFFLPVACSTVSFIAVVARTASCASSCVAFVSFFTSSTETLNSLSLTGSEVSAVFSSVFVSDSLLASSFASVLDSTLSSTFGSLMALFSTIEVSLDGVAGADSVASFVFWSLDATVSTLVGVESIPTASLAESVRLLSSTRDSFMACVDSVPSGLFVERVRISFFFASLIFEVST